LRNGATDNLVFDLDALAPFVRLNLHVGMAVLAAPAGLANELSFALSRFREGLAIGDLRGARARLDLEFTEQTVPDDFEVQLTHPGNDKLAGFLVRKATEGWIFFRE